MTQASHQQTLDFDRIVLKNTGSLNDTQTQKHQEKRSNEFGPEGHWVMNVIEGNRFCKRRILQFSLCSKTFGFCWSTSLKRKWTKKLCSKLAF
jgi:hypothetical protein